MLQNMIADPPVGPAHFRLQLRIALPAKLAGTRQKTIALVHRQAYGNIGAPAA